jgi:ribose transport system permease protein
MSGETGAAAAPAPTRPRWRIPRGAIVYLGFILLFAVFAVVLRDKGFLTVDNQLNVLRQTAFVSVMAFGMTFALSAGEIDLSIGQVVALSAMVVAVLLRDANALVAVPAGLLVGIAVGLANGLLTTRLRVPSFLITLGMAGIVGGLSRWITNLNPVPVLDDPYTFVFGSGNIGPVPSLLIWTLVALVIAHVAYRKTTFGREILANGGNRTAARYSGINTTRIRVAALVICSFTASLAGLCTWAPAQRALHAGRDGPAHGHCGRRDRWHQHRRWPGVDRQRPRGLAAHGRAQQRADPDGPVRHRADGGPRRDHHRRRRPQPPRGPEA